MGRIILPVAVVMASLLVIAGVSWAQEVPDGATLVVQDNAVECLSQFANLFESPRDALDPDSSDFLDSWDEALATLTAEESRCARIDPAAEIDPQARRAVAALRDVLYWDDPPTSRWAEIYSDLRLLTQTGGAGERFAAWHIITTAWSLASALRHVHAFAALSEAREWSSTLMAMVVGNADHVTSETPWGWYVQRRQLTEYAHHLPEGWVLGVTQIDFPMFSGGLSPNVMDAVAAQMRALPSCMAAETSLAGLLQETLASDLHFDGFNWGESTFAETTHFFTDHCVLAYAHRPLTEAEAAHIASLYPSEIDETMLDLPNLDGECEEPYPPGPVVEISNSFVAINGSVVADLETTSDQSEIWSAVQTALSDFFDRHAEAWITEYPLSTTMDVYVAADRNTSFEHLRSLLTSINGTRQFAPYLIGSAPAGRACQTRDLVDLIDLTQESWVTFVSIAVSSAGVDETSLTLPEIEPNEIQIIIRGDAESTAQQVFDAIGTVETSFPEAWIRSITLVLPDEGAPELEVQPEGSGESVDDSSIVEGDMRSRDAQTRGSGSLDADTLRNELQLHSRDIRRCYERALVTDLTLSGRVVIQFEIGVDGRVSSERLVENELGETAGECITGRMRRWRFTEPEGGAVTVRKTYILEPALSD